MQKDTIRKNSISKLVGNADYDDEVLSVYLLKDRKVQGGDWLLICRIGGNKKVSNVGWMYVSTVEEILDDKSKIYKQGYRYIAIQIKIHPIEDDQPFKAGVRFREALSIVLSSKKLNSVYPGNVLTPSGVWLEKIDRKMRLGKKE